MGHVATDDMLIARSAGGDRQAFGLLVERHLDAVRRVTLRKTRDVALAQDITQEAFVVAWHNIATVRDPSRLRSWLCRIAARLAIRAKTRMREDATEHELLNEMIVDKQTPASLLQQAQTAAFVQAAIAQLPATHRQVLTLYYQHERSLADVALSLGVSLDVATKRLSRARRHLAAYVTATMEVSLDEPRRQKTVAAVLASLPPIGAPVGSHMSPAQYPLPWQTTGAMTMSTKIIATMVAATIGGAAWLHISPTSTDPSPRSNHAAMPALATAQREGGTSATLAPSLPSTSSMPVRSAQVPQVPQAAQPPAIAAQAGTHCDACEQAMPSKLLSQAELQRLRPDDGPARGPANAAVKIVVFADLQCPYCSAVLGTLDQLADEYPGQLRMVYKNFPLPSHDQAMPAAEAAMAAGAQGKFWEFHDTLLGLQDELSRQTYVRVATQLQLDIDRFTADLEAGQHRAAVARDVEDARAIGVQGTPSFVINGRLFAGARRIEDFRVIINELLPRR